MAASQHIEFGYNPPSGDRGRETIRPREYQSDLKAALDVATQGFKSIWVADHLNYSTEWRLECWTLLTWIAARYPDVGLSTLVMSNTFRHPSVMAKMGAALQELSGGRFALGYGAGWHEGEHDAFGLELYRPGGTDRPHGRGDPGDKGAVVRCPGQLFRPLLLVEQRPRRAAARPGPADNDRRRGRKEDAAGGRQVRRLVERRRPAGTPNYGTS